MIKIIFASVTGNTERVCRYIAQNLSEKAGNIESELIRAEQFKSIMFNQNDTFLIATSTWDMGQMNQFLDALYEEIVTANLTGVKVAFIGLGDRVYGDENYCKAMEMFRERAIGVGAFEILPPLYIDGEPDGLFDSVVAEWVGQLIPLVSPQ